MNHGEKNECEKRHNKNKQFHCNTCIIDNRIVMDKRHKAVVLKISVKKKGLSKEGQVILNEWEQTIMMELWSPSQGK